MPKLNCPPTTSVSCTVASALALRTWLVKNGYVYNDYPRIRHFFRDLKAGQWTRRSVALPKPTDEKRSPRTKLDLDQESWQYIAKAVATLFHNDASYLFQDIADGNWRRIAPKKPEHC